jgi:DNA-binding transcriptional ArsR family regulator
MAAIGALLADPGRCRVLLALDDGRALPASRLAEEAGVAASTASGHLSKLVEAGLLTVQPQGLHRSYRLTADGRAWLEDLGVTIPPARSAVRYCIDWTEQRHHLSGALGRNLQQRMAELDWIRRSPSTRAVTVTDTGRAGLAETFDVRL